MPLPTKQVPTVDRVALKRYLTDDPDGHGFRDAFAANDDTQFLPFLNDFRHAFNPEGIPVTQDDVNASLPDYVVVSRRTEAETKSAEWREEETARLIAVGRKKLQDRVAGEIVDAVLTTDGKVGFVPGTDHHSAAIRARLAETGKDDLTDEELAEIAHAEMLRTGGGK